jgi:pimeloyl-ACP methyl ester carboxylesterase
MILVASTYWGGAPFNFRSMPKDVSVEPVLLKAADHRELQGLYWTPSGNETPRVAVVAMHPRVDFTRHYSFPRLLEAGVACLGANTRNPNNDTDTVHEAIILDVGACIAHLRDRGVEHVVLLGNSGGGSLNALYQSQARVAPEARLAETPAGAPTRLERVDLSPADAMIYVSAHKGEGRIMNECIDPAVVDERDPLISDPELDMYDARNGFRPPPEWSEFGPAFVQRYRAAQLARVSRLDATARALVNESQRAAALHADAEFAKLDAMEQQRILRHEALEPVMVVYRSMANLHYADRHLDPSPREYGSLLSDRPDVMNVSLMGFGRLCTPRAWLSTWSGHSSRADLLQTLPTIEEPTLVVNAGRDREIYPVNDAQPIFEAVASPDRTFVEFPEARHYFEPDFGESHAPAVEALMDTIIPWIRERFPAGGP